MPRPHPPKFRRRAVELARLQEQPVAKIVEDLGISESCLRNWMAQADVDDGRRPGLTNEERAELSRCAARTGCSSWRSRSSSGRPPPSPGRTTSQSDLRLHR